jgi:hypothetical protein
MLHIGVMGDKRRSRDHRCHATEAVQEAVTPVGKHGGPDCGGMDPGRLDGGRLDRGGRHGSESPCSATMAQTIK